MKTDICSVEGTYLCRRVSQVNAQNQNLSRNRAGHHDKLDTNTCWNFGRMQPTERMCRFEGAEYRPCIKNR